MQHFEHVHDEQERQLIEMLSFLQNEYVKAAKPYIDMLVATRQRRIPPQMIVTLEQAHALSISPESTP